MLALAYSDRTTRSRRERVTFEACYTAHRNDVYRRCLRYSGGRAGWAEDVTHDVFVKLLEHLPTLADTDDLGGWLYRVGTNLCITRLRREQTMLGRLRSLFDPRPAEAPSVEVVRECQEEAAAALAVVSTLPAQERAVLCMKLLDGKEQKEIAEILSMSEGYVSKLLARAWTKIRVAGWEVDHDAR
jgi:RNA polymerase sigma-70 factor (ECF subfamily)